MGQKDLTNANDYIEIDIARFRNGAVYVQTGAANNALANFVLEFTGLNTAAGGAREYITPIAMTDPTTQGIVLALTGVSKSGWAEAPGVSSVRVRRTDANVGTGVVSIEHREG